MLLLGQAAYQAAVQLDQEVNAVMKREDERLELAQLMDREGFDLRPNPHRKLVKDGNLIKVWWPVPAPGLLLAM